MNMTEQKRHNENRCHRHPFEKVYEVDTDVVRVCSYQDPIIWKNVHAVQIRTNYEEDLPGGVFDDIANIVVDGEMSPGSGLWCISIRFSTPRFGYTNGDLGELRIIR